MGSEVEVLIRKNIVMFCNILPGHVETWRTALQESAPIVRGVVNRAEQLRHVHQAEIKYIEGFSESKQILEYNIMTGIEEELELLNTHVAKLNKANQDLRNKLAVLESSTLYLDWAAEGDSPALKGSGSVPSLSRLLQSALTFRTFFHASFRAIADSLKNMNWLDEKGMTGFEKAFEVDLEDDGVTYLLAITQYVGNEKDIL